MLNRCAKVCHLHHGWLPTKGSAALRSYLARGSVCILLVLAGCAEVPVQGRQITGAAPIRHAQTFDTEVVSASEGQCIVRTKLPDQRLPGTWIDERNSALRAALNQAKQCCPSPRLALVEDWMVGFTAYEATFLCPEPGQ